MQYFKNTELADLYHVSEKAVRNWIEAAQNGKLALTLYQDSDRLRVANTAKNKVILQDLVERAKKYKNVRFRKVISPKQEFYSVFDSSQIIDMILSIEAYRELPLQYTYFNGGAHYWDKYAQRLMWEENPNTLKSTIQLLESNLGNIDRLIGSHKKINVVDLGVGNGLPVRKLLEHLLDKKLLNRYIGIDLSPEMFKVAEENIRNWFGDKIKIEKHIKDISRDRFRDVLIDDYSQSYDEAPLNLVLLLGGTLSNFRIPQDSLRAINNSMAAQDRIIYSLKLDTPGSRQYFDFSHLSSKAKILPIRNNTLLPDMRLLPELLGIKADLYDAQQRFDSKKRVRTISIRFNIDITLEFVLPNGKRQISLNKDDELLLWRAWHWNAHEVIDQFATNGFDLLQASQTNDHDYLLTISEIKTQPDR
jgi:SAM-dependent methyltransferase